MMDMGDEHSQAITDAYGVHSISPHANSCECIVPRYEWNYAILFVSMTLCASLCNGEKGKVSRYEPLWRLYRGICLSRVDMIVS